MKKLNLNENFISRIWENPVYYNELITTRNEKVEIIDYGKRNFDSGADYSNAKVRINGIIFKGDIEIHRSEKDWHIHKHKDDGKYEKVILHVVMWESDGDNVAVLKKYGEIPTVILSKFLSKSIHEIWKDIINNPSENFKLPCYLKNSDISIDEKRDFLNNTGMKRLRYRASRIEKLYFESQQDSNEKSKWDKILLMYIAEALGFSKNKEQFLKLTGQININSIKSLNPDLQKIDAFLFGIAGFLDDFKPMDEYSEKLISDWESIHTLAGENVMDKSEWHFFRLRPPNFPTLRIAYLSGILYEILFNDFFKRIILCFEKSKNPSTELKKLFLNISVSDYWNIHYHFGKKKNFKSKIIGSSRINDIIINTILPVITLYAEKYDKKDLMTKLTGFYLITEDISENEITKVMQSQLLYNLKTISEKQGAIHLHNFFCVEGKCSDCFIGSKIFPKQLVQDCLRIIFY